MFVQWVKDKKGLGAFLKQTDIERVTNDDNLSWNSPPSVLQFSKKSVVSGRDCCQRHILRAFLIVGLSEEIRGKAKHIRYQIFFSSMNQRLYSTIYSSYIQCQCTVIVAILQHHISCHKMHKIYFNRHVWLDVVFNLTTEGTTLHPHDGKPPP